MHKLAVKLDGIERRKRTTGVLHIAAGAFLLLQAIDYFTTQPVHNFQRVWFFFAAALVSIIYGVLKKFRDPHARLNRWVRLLQVCAFAILAVNYTTLGRTITVILLFTWAIACLLLMFTERKVFHDAEMVFDREGIFIPGYFSNRRIFWNSISDVTVRPDYITIFQVNDTFLQYEVLKKLAPATLDKIALYCSSQIAESRKTTSL